MNEHYLTKALEFASRQRGFCAPNPAVGAIVVKNSEMIGHGYHRGPGYPHAEVEALKDLGEAAKNATVYVTLEPCCHWGRTPPCTDLLEQTQIKEVIYGYADPNPQIAGKGAKTLQAAGIRCEHYPLSAINAFYASYAFWWQYNRPFVTLKLAQSIDGKIAAARGKPVQITGSQTNLFTHQQRKQADAILTTVKTIVQDDPALNARLAEGDYSKPIYVLDTHLSFPASAKILTTAASITLFYSTQVTDDRLQLLRKKNIRCIAVEKGNQGLNLLEILKIIGKEGKHDLWVEAGARCFQAFIANGLAQQAYVYIGTNSLGENAYPGITFPGLFTQAQTMNWKMNATDAICKITW